MGKNIITPDDKREVLNEVVIGGLTVTEDGKVNGYIKKEVREHINFDELFEESDRVKGKARLSFQKTTDEHEH